MQTTKKSGLRVVVPFFENPQLVRPLFESLVACAAELRELSASLIFYNDSPGHAALKVELDRCLTRAAELEVTVVENACNLGFVRTMNLAFADAVRARDDIVLLNSDTRVFPGTFAALLRVAQSDPMIGFVSPRSNNATLCTLPHGVESLQLSPADAFARFRAVSHHLPSASYVPTAVGFCLYVKWHMLAEFGGFDEDYGKGYNEENDLIMRANRCGYRAALANHAFVWHQGEQSFGGLESSRTVREAANAKLLNARYPEYAALVRAYFGSPEYRAEGLVSAACSSDATARVSIVFDFSDFGSYHNGTFEAGKRLLAAAARCWPATIDVCVLMAAEAWAFHRLDLEPRVRRVDSHQVNESFAAIVRMGQPFEVQSLARIMTRAPVVGVFMLDAIASDCGYLKVGLDEALWHYTMRWADVVFTNSEFTAAQLRRRFVIGERTVVCPTLHSVSPNDYAQPGSAAHPMDGGAALSALRLSRVSLLVVGNSFDHKALRSTVLRLAASLPSFEIIALGCSGLSLPNVRCVESGTLSAEEMEGLYAAADALVYPSHYEGFGFPLLHALARSKPIYVRRLPVFAEIVARVTEGAENVRWFETTDDLVECLIGGVAPWSGPCAQGEVNGWDRSAREVYDALAARIETVSSGHVAERLRWFDLAFGHRVGVAAKRRFGLRTLARWVRRTAIGAGRWCASKLLVRG